MTNADLLEIALIKCKISKKELAEHIGISHQALYNKLNNVAEFKASEIFKISELLNLSGSERESIFFAHQVENNSTD